ncbi:acetate--CoA ligase [Candidatus Methanoperedens nitroreducens]|uniref:Acetyl-coenzyme A synthetase n=1 Tax=Candidatus Methanoperedens nitratireducens TaxID=1392998 RepID=A0A062V6P4_9EURY|nr:acetate--CoA ligase [Candidatus Methanoperedens nitroreducens]KCZ71075.1 acetate--CoA ligase [Candidatus Methanoperedens nitroreducens]MDJ1421552.1 acetate--CoA ligase [Candidatus Methanoperedens sp.]
MAENTIESLLKERRIFNPKEEFSKKAYIKSLSDYREIYNDSIKDPASFWAQIAEQLTWFKKWDSVHSWDPQDAICKWFSGGRLNASYNCLDRHLSERGDRIAILWEGEPGDTQSYTYRQLYTEVCKFANVLKKKGIKRGDRIAIYMPMIPQLAIAMLACARIGAIHSVVFAGFSADSLRGRIHDSACKMVITADAGFRSGKTIPIKKSVDMALNSDIEHVIIYNRASTEVNMKEGRDFWWHEEMETASMDCEPEAMDAEDPLFILYTSGSTGKPKGVLHTTGGYLLYVMQTFKWIFDYRDEDIYWCTADIGWITGHSYTVYGPLASGATCLMFEGVPDYPRPDRFWELVEKYRVTIFYTAPTAIRALERSGDKWPKGRDLSSLRLLGTVGEPINPEAWMWYYSIIGNNECPVVDTWWQTETGGIMITPLPGAIPLKPGSATFPFPGIEPAVLRPDGIEADINEGGLLVIKRPWPGMMRTVYGNHARFKETYFTQFPGLYTTGDSARKDEDGYFWIMGRIDDVIKVSGHRLGPAEIESALVAHPKVAEAAVVGYPHEIKGEAIYAFVTLKEGVRYSKELKAELIDHVRNTIGPIAKPEKLQFADALPKTRSGKIMRRILRKIASGEIDKLGDITTLADPSAVEVLVRERE